MSILRNHQPLPPGGSVEARGAFLLFPRQRLPSSPRAQATGPSVSPVPGPRRAEAGLAAGQGEVQSKEASTGPSPILTGAAHGARRVQSGAVKGLTVCSLWQRHWPGESQPCRPLGSCGARQADEGKPVSSSPRRRPPFHTPSGSTKLGRTRGATSAAAGHHFGRCFGRLG